MGYDINNVLNKAFKNIGDHFMLLSKVGLLLYVLPAFVVQIIVMLLIMFAYAGLTYADAMSNPVALIGTFGSAFFIFLALIIVVSLLQLLFSITIIKTFQQKREGVDLTASQAISKSKVFFGSAILLSFIMGFALLGLTLLLIIPAIIFGIYWMFSMYALVLDGKQPTEAMSYSKQIVKGSWWAMFLTIIVLAVANLIIGLIIGLLTWPLAFVPILGDLVSTGISLLLNMCLTIAVIAIYESIYLDLKAQKEGMPIESVPPQQPAQPQQPDQPPKLNDQPDAVEPIKPGF